jgi:molecular chaperone DnaK (HSP70)
MSDKMKRIFGIDLGTTYSSIAYVDEYGKPVIVPNSENQRITPSVVFFDGGIIVVGEVAKESSKLYPNEVVSFIKRSMGEPDWVFEYDGKVYRPEEISSFILRKVVQDAEQNLGEKVTDVVITCPAYFGINEREATRRAGEIAGFNVRQIINEPTAAAIAYGAVDPSEKRVVLVYDLGGGTFDTTLIDIQPDTIEVICTGGDHNLGGKDWDDRIITYLVKEFQKQTGSDEDILEDPDTCQDLQLSAEKAKKILTQREKTPIAITHGGERVKVELARDKFEEITQDLLERTIVFTRDILGEAKRKGYEEFDDIILVGGATRMPQVAQRIKDEFSLAPKIFDPDEAVAKGAAIYGWKLSLNDGLVKRVAEKEQKPELEIGDVIDLREDMVVKEAARELAEETGYTLPAVESSLIQIKDVSSKSFGVVVRNPNEEELVYNIIVKNTPVPVQGKKTFFTAVANQETVLIRIMENETGQQTISPGHAVEIGTAILNLPKGLPQDLPIDINFNLNREGRLEMTAVETSERRKIAVVIETTAVIEGDDLEEAISRRQSLVVH